MTSPMEPASYKRVVLTFDAGSITQGFSLTLQIGQEGELPQVVTAAQLPPNPSLLEQFEQWEKAYHNLSISGRPIGLPKQQTVSTKASCETASQVLRHGFNQWFRQPDVSPLRDAWLSYLEANDTVRIILQTDSQIIQRLPWHQWDLLERLPYAEIALAARSFERLSVGIKPVFPVPVLAVLGDTSGINIDEDRRILTGLPESEIKFLVEPRRAQLTDELWQQTWPILFFAGHSCSEQDGGKLAINADETLRLQELKFSLKRAVRQGLQLAIFNSCDGLGLAREFADLNIPQLIIMREPVPDRVAQAFLKYFLRAYTGGAPLYLAVREARERLQALEDDFPCATGLPMIFQHPAAQPPRWRDLVAAQPPSLPIAEPAPSGPTPSPAAPSPSAAPSPVVPPVPAPSLAHPAVAEVPTQAVAPRSSLPLAVAEGDVRSPASSAATPLEPTPARLSLAPRRFTLGGLGKQLGRALGMSTAIATTILGVRHLGWLQPLELKAFDQLLQLRPEELPESRILVITVTEADLKLQADRDPEESLSDSSLNRMLSILEKHDPAVIGLDIYRRGDRPTPVKALGDRLRNRDNLIATCRVNEAPSSENAHSYDNAKGSLPPPEVPPERLGFSDSLPDGDGIQRRQLLSMTLPADSPCPSPWSLSTMLALQYLSFEGITLDNPAPDQLYLGDHLIPLIRRNSGGYQSVDPWGYQTLLNYRSHRGIEKSIAHRLTLQQVLDEAFRPEVVRDRIVLIGTTAESFGDYSPTPYNPRTPGVFIQAQMISQLISAPLDGRPFLWVPARRIEILWIASFSLVGGLVGWAIQSRKTSPLLWGGWGGLLLVHGLICFVLLAQWGAWLPLVPASLGFLLSAALGFRSHAPPLGQGKGSENRAHSPVFAAAHPHGTRASRTNNDTAASSIHPEP